MLHGFVARFYYYFLGYDISNASGIPRARYQFAMVSRQCPFYEPARMCCCYYICGTRLSIPVTIFRSFSKAKRYRIVHKENPPHEIWINARSPFALLRLIVAGPSLIYPSTEQQDASLKWIQILAISLFRVENQFSFIRSNFARELGEINRWRNKKKNHAEGTREIREKKRERRRSRILETRAAIFRWNNDKIRLFFVPFRNNFFITRTNLANSFCH